MKRPQHNGDLETGSKRRRRISSSEEDDTPKACVMPGAPGFSEAPPMHKIYNSSCRKEKPDELFRKDLISAMKLPDSEQLEETDFWDVSDSWKQEWERGVQVPVNSKNVPNPNCRTFREKTKSNPFKFPKKLIRTTEDDFFSSDVHVHMDVAAKAEDVCKYDMDDLDCEWLKLFNERREDFGLPLLDEDTMEKVLEDFEKQCSNRFQEALKTEKGLGIEYDEDVICDVCRSPDCEEGNEMVFCDACNICVHQACYGIMAIPEGSWVCRPCASNVKPICILCPNAGGAMKCTSDGENWAHVSCALWIPEVTIGCPEKMEPIQKISQIPASRWSLICTLCRDRVGACIQCSVKTCKVAYHVTCAFENGLEMDMKATTVDSKEEGVKMQSFCEKHIKTRENGVERSPSVTKSPRKSRKRKEVKKVNTETSEVDEHNARLQKIRSLEAQFHKFVSVKDTANFHNIDIHVVDFIYCYWALKRRSKFNKPLLITKGDEGNLLIKEHENLLYSQLKMFVHLRQDLERVRNLCYMIGRREKLFRIFTRMKRDVFDKQDEILNDESFNLTVKEKEEIIKARLGDKLLERFYCTDPADSSEDLASKANSPQKQPNPYAKSYVNSVNTRSRRRTTSQSQMDSAIDQCDSESNEMPVLTKCRSEENISSTGTENEGSDPPSFSNSPFIVKLESKKSKEHTNSPKLEMETWVLNSKDSGKGDSISEKHKKADFVDKETLKVSSENTHTKRKYSVITETSNDKNSLSLCDKENINAQNTPKSKKGRGQLDLPIDLPSQKSDLFEGDTVGNEINGTKHFRLGNRKTRYQMRNRHFSTDIDAESMLLRVVDFSDASIDHISSPSNSNEDLTFNSPARESLNDCLPIISSSPETPKRKRGRPRKYPLQPKVQTEPEDEKLPVIHNECSLDTPPVEPILTEPINGILDLLDSADSSEFRMSLRHNREQSQPQTLKKKMRKLRIKIDQSDHTPLKEANKDMQCEMDDLSVESTQSSPNWNGDDTQPPTLVEQPSRIVIRLRKDPNQESSWKNDSSSSSDIPMAFRIVQNDLDINAVSEFPSKINGSDSPPMYLIKDDFEGGRRYPMRERSSAPRNVTLTLGRS